jgi:hypothetical protein
MAEPSPRLTSKPPCHARPLAASRSPISPREGDLVVGDDEVEHDRPIAASAAMPNSFRQRSSRLPPGGQRRSRRRCRSLANHIRRHDLR